MDATSPGMIDAKQVHNLTGSSETLRSSAAEVPPDDQTMTPGRRDFKTKEEKRLEAEERNRLSRIIRTVKSELKSLENRIIHLEEKKAVHERTLCGPDIYREPQHIKQLNQELVDIAKELEELYVSWEDVTKKLEALH
jgi:ATP-binding cassette subfamily F protein 3